MYLHLRPVNGDAAFKDRAAQRAALCTPVRASSTDGRAAVAVSVGTAAGDMEFFFGPNDQIEMAQYLLELLCAILVMRR